MTRNSFFFSFVLPENEPRLLSHVEPLLFVHLTGFTYEFNLGTPISSSIVPGRSGDSDLSVAFQLSREGRVFGGRYTTPRTGVIVVSNLYFLEIYIFGDTFYL